MTIAEKIARAKTDYDNVYSAGVEAGNSLYYASVMSGTYENSVFPENYEMTLKFQKTPNDLYRAFTSAKNLKSVKIIADDKEEIIVKLSSTFRQNADIEIVDLTECSRKFSAMSYAFFQAQNVKSIIGELDLSECADDTKLTYAFFAGSLEEVRFVANTIKAAIRFLSPYLTPKSRQSIVDGLADLTDSEPQTLTVNSGMTPFTEEQKAQIKAKNWTLAY